MTEVLTVPRIQAIKKLNFSLLLIEIQRTLKCLNDDKNYFDPNSQNCTRPTKSRLKNLSKQT